MPNPTAVDRLEYAWGGLGSETTELRNVYYNQCLDVPDSSQANDVQLQVHGCLNGGNQQWTRQANGEITVYNGTKCLDAFGFGKTNGTQVVIHDCPGGTNQQWLFFSDGTVRGVDSHLCLDADLGSPQNLQLWSCGGGTNQKWRLSGGTIGLRAHANGQIVTAESAGAQPLIANRVVVDAWETFDFIDNADGSVSLRAHANSTVRRRPQRRRVVADRRQLHHRRGRGVRPHLQPRRQRQLPRPRQQPDRDRGVRRRAAADRQPHRRRPLGGVRHSRLALAPAARGSSAKRRTRALVRIILKTIPNECALRHPARCRTSAAAGTYPRATCASCG